MAQLKPLQTKQWLALLATLFVIVLIAHLAILTSARGQFSIQKTGKIASFTTRMIELPAIVPVVEKVPEVVSPPKPVKVKPAVVMTPKPVPKPVPRASPILIPIPAEIATAPEPPTVQPKTTVEVTALIPIPISTPTPEPAPSTPTATSSDSALPPPAFVAPISAQHNYKLIYSQKGSIYQGKAEISLQQDGEKYALSLSASQLLYGITWKSTGLMSPQGLMPERFSDKRSFKSEVAAHFDRTAGKIIFSVNTPQARLETGAQDRISIIWQLAGLLAAEPSRYPPGTTLSIQTVDDREAQTWIFTVNEPETLNLENGSQFVVRLTRNPRREFDRKIELWFAPAMGYLPVRFRQTQTNGDYEDMVWQSMQTLPDTLPR